MNRIHSIPTIGFAFSIIKNKLRPELAGRPGKEIAAMRKAGEAVTHEVAEKKLAFICDTSIEALEAQPDILLYPVIIIECTFLLPDELQNAHDTKHIHWQQLLPYVQAHPEVTFVLIHFSLRYRDSEIAAFFDEQCRLHNISNIKPWLTDPVDADAEDAPDGAAAAASNS